MNGPFYVPASGDRVCDARHNTIATGEGDNEDEERRNARMVCDALNAIFYATQAVGRAS